MFKSARLRLTAWYVLLIVLITLAFSFAMYVIATRDLSRLIDHAKQRDQIMRLREPIRPVSYFPPGPTVNELEAIRSQVVINLVILNAFIWIGSAIAAYFLAGRTLSPIKAMMDEQVRFVSDASHELRTPLAVLKTELESSLLEKKISDKQARQIITSNLEEVNHLQQLTTGLLQLSSPEANHHELLNLAEVVELAERQVTTLAKNKTVKVDVSGLSSASVLGNPEALKQVFTILLENAIKYSSNKSAVTVKIASDGDDYKVIVRDQGIGISAEDLPHIFDRFYRADASRSKIEGYGLGLAIAQTIITAHHGTIEVESEPNKGSVFIVWLPKSSQS